MNGMMPRAERRAVAVKASVSMKRTGKQRRSDENASDA
jgi:hypothetical protein